MQPKVYIKKPQIGGKLLLFQVKYKQVITNGGIHHDVR